MSIQFNMDLCFLMRELWKKDKMTLLHSNRVTRIVVSFAEFLSLSKNEKKVLELGALLHDIGKLEIKNEILTKPDKLTDDEFLEIKKHPKYGSDILRSFQLDPEIWKMALFHHEKWDGTGYPFGLNENNIPFYARILTLADSLEAMTGIRPYRNSLTWENASLEIEKQIGKQYDPTLAYPFLTWMKKIEIPIEWNDKILFDKDCNL